MPILPTYPGVYIEEVPSGVRTITGVSTAITAFLGRASRGPANEPTRVQNFGEYERIFGGLSVDSTMSYAVRHYFLNGGADALIVRVVDTDGIASRVELAAGADTLTLEALEGGDAGNSLRATVTHDDVDPPNFNLVITEVDEDDNVVTTETFSDIAIGELVDELDANSALVRALEESLPAGRPNVAANAPFAGGEEAALAATISLDATTNGNETLMLEAASEGAWGNNLQAMVDYDTADTTDTSLFNLTVFYIVGGEVLATEQFRNVSADSASSRYVADVLRFESTLARVDETTFPSARPDETVDADGAFVSVPSNDDGSDGPELTDARYVGSQNDKTGLYALENADLFNILCIPPINRTTDIDPATWTEALAYCKERRAMLIVDPPTAWARVATVATGGVSVDSLGLRDENAAIYFPRVRMADPLRDNRLESFVPCGLVAGVWARTDSERGVWKAPAGQDATLLGVRELTVKMTDGENGILNPLGVNCLRTFPVIGNVVWGARTLEGADRLASEWKYVPVRRLALFIEESLYRGTQWVVFEPNDEPLWAQIRLNVGSFMQNLFRQGAFQGRSPREAYFVKCDSETTTQSDINAGVVNVLVGFAPLKPAEFVIVRIQQMAGQIEA